MQPWSLLPRLEMMHVSPVLPACAHAVGVPFAPGSPEAAGGQLEGRQGPDASRGAASRASRNAALFAVRARPGARPPWRWLLLPAFRARFPNQVAVTPFHARRRAAEHGLLSNSVGAGRPCRFACAGQYWLALTTCQTSSDRRAAAPDSCGN